MWTYFLIGALIYFVIFCRPKKEQERCDSPPSTTITYRDPVNGYIDVNPDDLRLINANQTCYDCDSLVVSSDEITIMHLSGARKCKGRSRFYCKKTECGQELK